MERLTERIGSSISYSDFNSNNSDSCYESTDKCLHRLADYEDAEEQGLLIRLPVAEGSVVYVIDYTYECKFDYSCKLPFNGYKCEEDIRCEHEYKKYRVREATFNHMMLGKIGKTVFLSKAEAEQALAKMEGE